MHKRHLTTSLLMTALLLALAGSAYAQESAAEAAAPDIAPLVFLIGAGLVVALGAYMAMNARVSKEE
jgi:FtsH-binding integral membrane protein